MTATIEAHSLEKRYRKTRALDRLELVAESGQVTAVLGPNGAGKTTFVRAVATLLRPDSGTLHVLGHDVRREPERVRQLLGLAGQFAAVEPAMSGRENLEMVARLYGQSRRTARASAQRVLEQLDLVEPADRLVRTYSGGMRRRLDLGASLVGQPRLLLLDEPTTGLDPRGRNDVWEAVRGLVAGGTTVLLTTQYLDEADQLADQICVIDAGRVVADGTPAQLKAAIGADHIDVVVRDASDLPATAAVLDRVAPAIVRVDRDTRRVSAPVAGGTGGSAGPMAALVAVVRELHDAGIAVEDVGVRRPTLDEVFLHLTSTKDREETTEVVA
jgi:ABC-2 type transport system ATP-binding protein